MSDARMADISGPAEAAPDFELSLLSDIGSDRENNEDACGHWVESSASLVFAVADGVGGYEGGEVASRMAVDITLDAYRDSPPAWGAGKRLARAVQQANIEIHNRAITVPELRRMATTLTAVAVDHGVLTAAHIGDCRVYHCRGKSVRQITKDHTLIGERMRMGLISAREARNHPERSALSRCLGRELIVSVDRISLPLQLNDVVVLCSDGLYSVFEDVEIGPLVQSRSVQEGCQELIDGGNRRGTADNLTAVVFRLLRGAPPPQPLGWRARIRRLFRRDG